MTLQLNDAYMFVLWAGGLALQINLLSLSLSHDFMNIWIHIHCTRVSGLCSNLVLFAMKRELICLLKKVKCSIQYFNQC